MKHLHLKRIWAVITVIVMILMLPIMATADTKDEKTGTGESLSGIERWKEKESTGAIAKTKIELPEGVPELIVAKDLDSLSRAMGDLEKLDEDLRKEGEDCGAFERFCNSRVLLKGVPDLTGFRPLQVILDPYGCYVIQFESVSEAERFIEKQSSNPDVVWAEQDAPVYSDEPDTETEDEELYNAAHLGSDSTKYVHAEELVKYIYENGLDNEVTVAVLDHGCELTHSFLKDRFVPDPPEGTIRDFVDNDGDPTDNDGHGTHVAGIVVECTGDEYRALNVRIMPVRVLGDHSTISSIYRGICYAADNGADVINLSLVVDTEFGSVEDAARYAVDKGCVVCAASGNNGGGNWNKSPANSLYPGVVTVGALKKAEPDWTICWYSNRGESVDIAAPGDSIYSSVLNNQFNYKSGTSMATPHVSAAAAMIRQMYPGLSPATVEEILTAATIDAGEPGRDTYYGCGNLQMQKILELDTHAPSVTGNPESVTAEWGTIVGFSAAGEGIGLTYRWQYREDETADWKDVTDGFASATDYAVLALDENNGNEYRCCIENYWGSVYTEPATLTVTPRTGSGPFAEGTFESGAAWEIDTEMTLRLFGEGYTDFFNNPGEAPWYLWRNQIRAIDIGTGVIAISPYAFADLSEVTGVIIPEGMLYIGDRCFYNCDALRWVVIPESMAEIGGYAFCDCDAFTDVFFAADHFPKYYPAIDGQCFPSGTRIHMSYSGPVILNQPVSADAIEGEQASFAIEAVGADPTYQWYYRTTAGSEWQMVTDEEGTKTEYTVISSREMDGWQYRCLIKDMIGETYSDAIPLYVSYNSPVITRQPGLLRGKLGTKTLLSVKADGGGLRYQWEYRQADSNEWRPAEEASGTNASLIIGFTEDKIGNAYRCVVSNALGTAVSRAVMMTVLPSLKPFQEKEIKPINPIIIDPPIVIDPPVLVRPPVQSRLKMNKGK